MMVVSSARTGSVLTLEQAMHLGYELQHGPGCARRNRGLVMSVTS